jgi:hypothetical protein
MRGTRRQRGLGLQAIPLATSIYLIVTDKPAWATHFRFGASGTLLHDCFSQQPPFSKELYAKLTVAARGFLWALELTYFLMTSPLSLARPAVVAFHFAIGRDFLNAWMMPSCHVHTP